MITETEPAVLDRRERRHARLLHRFNVGSSVFRETEHPRAGFLQNRADCLQHRFHFRFSLDIEPDWMSSAAIGFHHREMVRPIFLVILGVLLGTAETVLFVHPRDHAYRS